MGNATTQWGPRIITDGLIMYLDAANSRSYSNTNLRDLTGNKSDHTFSLVNNPSFSATNLGTLTFNGSTQYGVSANPIAEVSSNFTMSAWVNIISNSGNYQGIFGTLNDNGNLYTYQGAAFWIKFGESRFSVIIGGSSGVIYIPADSNFVIGNWYNLTCINTGGITYFYINGILQTANSNYNITASQYGMKIGRAYAQTDAFYSNCKISNMIIYNRSLNIAEIQQNYNVLKNRYNL